MKDFADLVNKYSPLDSNYVPQDLVLVSNPYFNSLGNSRLEVVKEVYEAFKLMAGDALLQGYQIFIDSGYRSFNYQQEVLDYYLGLMGDEAYKKVAMPGTSEHQLGLAIDIASVINGQYFDELNDDMLVTKWVHDNAYKYGFILRYPKGKEEITGYNYEPWHFRFVGLDLAMKLKNSGLTLEEYKKNRGR